MYVIEDRGDVIDIEDRGDVVEDNGVL